MLKEGKIHAVGDPKNVLNEDNIREVYGVEAVIKEEDGRPYIVPKCPVRNCAECSQ